MFLEICARGLSAENMDHWEILSDNKKAWTFNLGDRHCRGEPVSMSPSRCDQKTFDITNSVLAKPVIIERPPYLRVCLLMNPKKRT